MASRAPPKRPIPAPPPRRSVPPVPLDASSFAVQFVPTNPVCTATRLGATSVPAGRVIPPPIPARRPSDGDAVPTTSANSDVDAVKARLISRKPPPRPVPAIPRRLPSLNESIPPPFTGSDTAPIPPPRPQRRPPLPTRRPTKETPQAASLTPAFEVLSQRRLPPPLARGSTPPPPPPVNLSTKPDLAPSTESDNGVCIKCYDFSAVDHHASLFPKHTIVSLPALARNLTEAFASETEKARAIYAWLAYNIVYDVESFMSGNIQAATPESTVRSGRAVCDGYAGLFMHLAQLAGIPGVFKVTGHGKGFVYRALQAGGQVPPFSVNHAWNRILLDGEWRLIDPCWGAGALNGTVWDQYLNPYWFTADIVEFGKRHHPMDSNDQCLAEGPISWMDYIAEPERPTIYGDFHTLAFDTHSITPEWDGIHSGERQSFYVSKGCCHMSGEEAENFVLLLHTDDNTRTPMAADGRGGWSATIYVPRDSDVTLYYVKTIDNRDGRGLTVKEYNWFGGRKAIGFGGLAKWKCL